MYICIYIYIYMYVYINISYTSSRIQRWVRMYNVERGLHPGGRLESQSMSTGVCCPLLSTMAVRLGLSASSRHRHVQTGAAAAVCVPIFVHISLLQSVSLDCRRDASSADRFSSCLNWMHFVRVFFRWQLYWFVGNILPCTVLRAIFCMEITRRIVR